MSATDNPSSTPGQYDPQDVEDLLAQVPASAEAILVGGQAINFWATRYVDKHPELGQFAPFTSADIDFVAGIKLAKRWARATGAQLIVPNANDHVAINTAKLLLPKLSENSLELDFLATVDGVQTKKARESALVVESEDGKLEFSVLHPMHCLASAITNTYGKQRRRDHPEGLGERARDRCRLTILLARAYLLEIVALYLNGSSAERPYDLIEYVAYVALTPQGLTAYIEDGTDILDAVAHDHENLDKLFKARRWPAILQEVNEARDHYKPGQVILRKRPKM